MPDGAYLAVNCSHRAAVSPELAALLAARTPTGSCWRSPSTRRSRTTTRLVEALAPLRARGARIAIDDAGAGFASLRHTLRIAPDIVKLDISLTRGIDTDRAKRALASALVSFADEMDIALVAEGIETRGGARRAAGARRRPTGRASSWPSPARSPDAAGAALLDARRSIAHDEARTPFVNCFISVATATASA